MALGGAAVTAATTSDIIATQSAAYQLYTTTQSSTSSTSAANAESARESAVALRDVTRKLEKIEQAINKGTDVTANGHGNVTTAIKEQTRKTKLAATNNKARK